MTPGHIDKMDVEGFKAWLDVNGRHLRDPTNEWEVVRYVSTSGKIAIVYQNKKGILKWMGASHNDYAAFQKGGGEMDVDHSVDPVNPIKSKVRPEVRAQLLERDGSSCWLCGELMPEGDRTIEHLLSRKDGGSNRLSNLVLAHERCNQEMDSRAVAEKVNMRDEYARRRESTPPWESVRKGEEP